MIITTEQNPSKTSLVLRNRSNNPESDFPELGTGTLCTASIPEVTPQFPGQINPMVVSRPLRASLRDEKAFSHQPEQTAITHNTSSVNLLQATLLTVYTICTLFHFIYLQTEKTSFKEKTYSKAL